MLDGMRASVKRLAASASIVVATVTGCVTTFGPVGDGLQEAGVPWEFVATGYLGIMVVGCILAVKTIRAPK